jgi:hypothetical protein
MKTYLEWSQEKWPQPPTWHCWLTLRRHTWEWHEGKSKCMAYAQCARCGWPGPIRVLPQE